MLQKEKFLRFKLFMWHPSSLVSSVCLCVAPAISFLELSPHEGPSCPLVHVFMRGLSFLFELNLSTSPLLKNTGCSLMGSNAEVKINALSSFSEPKIACACFSSDNFRKRGDSLFLPLFNIFGECSPRALKSSCHEERAVWSRFLSEFSWTLT